MATATNAGHVNINSDLGESFGPWVMGNDTEVLKIVASANRSTGFGLTRKLMFRLDVTAISTRPSRPSTTAYMAASARAMMVGPDRVPPGRTSLA